MRLIDYSAIIDYSVRAGGIFLGHAVYVHTACMSPHLNCQACAPTCA